MRDLYSDSSITIYILLLCHNGIIKKLQIIISEEEKTMLITITSKLGDDVQLWTFNIENEDLNALMEKYGHTGEGVLVDADDLPEDIKNYYK